VRNVAVETSSGRIIDLRNARGTNHPHLFQFTGVCVVDPAFFRYLPEPGVIESVVAAWLRAIEAGERLGGAVIDEGLWLDLGDRDSYLEAHRLILPATGNRIHPSARIAAGARVDDYSSVGDGCVIEEGAVVRGSVLWPAARVCAGSRLDSCVVMSGHTAAGVLKDTDL
jgi:NDP-sugar pyrophosphorylase family protein